MCVLVSGGDGQRLLKRGTKEEKGCIRVFQRVLMVD